MLLAKLRASLASTPRVCTWLAVSALLCASCQTGSEPASWSVTRASARTIEDSNLSVPLSSDAAPLLMIMFVLPVAIDVMLLPFTIPYDHAQAA